MLKLTALLLLHPQDAAGGVSVFPPSPFQSQVILAYRAVNGRETE